MRISFFTQWWPPEPANVVASLANELSRRGHDLEVVTGFPNYPTGRLYPGYRIRLRQIEQSTSLRTTRVSLFPSHDRSSAGRIANYVTFAAAASTVGLASVGRSDVAYVYHPPITSAWPARIQQVLRKIPYVLHVQDIWPESVVQSGMITSARKRDLVERVLNRVCSTTYRSARHIIVISEGFKEILVDRGVREEKISVVLNWADESVFAVGPADSTAREEIGPAATRVILYAGNLGDYQGLDTAILAVAPFGRRLHLTLVGDGIARDRLERLVQKRRIENVTILSQRPVSEMPRLLTAADAHLVSLSDLPFLASTIPGKTQVALATGKPLIVGVRGDAARLVTRAGAGVVCEPSEAGFGEAFTTISQMSTTDLQALGHSGLRFYRSHLSLRRGGGMIEEILKRAAKGDEAGPLRARDHGASGPGAGEPDFDP